MRIKANKAECVKCGRILQSTHVHDFRTHSCCPEIWFMVDGGLEYLRRWYKGGAKPEDNFIDRSEYETE